MEFVVEWKLSAWSLHINSGQSYGCNPYVGVDYAGMMRTFSWLLLCVSRNVL